MNKVLFLLVNFVILAVLSVSYSAATTYDFTDNTILWPGQVIPLTQNNDVDDTKDYIDDKVGTLPEVNGMHVTIESGKLKSVVIDIVNRNNAYVIPDALFINNDTVLTSTAWNDCSWDYYIQDNSTRDPGDRYGFLNLKKSDGEATLYGVKNTAGHNFYSYASGSLVRSGHANGIATGCGLNYLNTLQTGFDVKYSDGKLTYDFTKYLNIDMGLDWSIGYTPDCANDVIFVTNKGNQPPPENPVPEPATMFLLGIGLIGLAGVARKKISA